MTYTSPTPLLGPSSADQLLTCSLAGATATGASGTYNYLIDLILQVPATRAMYLRRLRTLMDTFLQGQLAQVQPSLAGAALSCCLGCRGKCITNVGGQQRDLLGVHRLRGDAAELLWSSWSAASLPTCSS